MTPPLTTYTKRDEVLALRRGYADGVCGARAHVSPVIEPCESCKRVAAERYPLPKVAEPRVVRDPHNLSTEWSIRPRRMSTDVSLHWRSLGALAGPEWREYPVDNAGYHHPPTPLRIELWAELFAIPTVLVDDPGVAGDD